MPPIPVGSKNTPAERTGVLQHCCSGSVDQVDQAMEMSSLPAAARRCDVSRVGEPCAAGRRLPALRIRTVGGRQQPVAVTWRLPDEAAESRTFTIIFPALKCTCTRRSDDR